MSTVADASPHEKLLSNPSTILRPAAFSVVSRLPLTAEEAYLFSRVDRPMTLSDIIAGSGLQEAKAYQLVFGLVEKGALLAAGEEEETDGRWGDFVFNPAELREEVDLDEERKKEILFTFHTLDRTSHYRLLGVKVDATTAQVRAAFHERSKSYHPDTYFRRRLGTYLPKMETIFQRLRQATDTLSDPEARRRYDRESTHVFTVEEQEALGKLEMTRVEDEMRAKERRQRLLKGKGFAVLTKARELLRAGDAALAQGDVAQALASYERALALDPRNEDARERLKEAQRIGMARRADLAYEEALNAELQQQHRRAIDLLRRGAGFDETSAKIQFALGRLIFLLEGRKAAREARLCVARSIELGENTSAAYRLLSEVELACGNKKAAQRAADTAKKLEQQGK